MKLELSEKAMLRHMSEALVETSVLLISNGANSARTIRNVKRIAKAFGYDVELFFSHSAVVLTASLRPIKDKYTIVKSIPHYGVNFSVVSEVSILSWKVADGYISFDEFQDCLTKVRSASSYAEWQKVVFIGLATAALCLIFDGTWLQGIISFFAGVLGFLARRAILLREYNVYIGFLIGAFVSASVVNLCRHFGVSEYNAALTSCVLWMIPGVPLINGFLDLLEGHIVSGWAKMSMGFIMVFMIAVGFYVSLFVFGYGNTI